MGIELHHHTDGRPPDVVQTTDIQLLAERRELLNKVEYLRNLLGRCEKKYITFAAERDAAVQSLEWTERKLAEARVAAQQAATRCDEWRQKAEVLQHDQAAWDDWQDAAPLDRPADRGFYGKASG